MPSSVSATSNRSPMSVRSRAPADALRPDVRPADFRLQGQLVTAAAVAGDVGPVLPRGLLAELGQDETRPPHHFCTARVAPDALA